MREATNNISVAVERVKNLKGIDLKLLINRGRNRFIRVDGVGQAGLEQSLDSYLSGKAGRVLEEIDGKGRELDYSASEYIAAVEGGSVTLTLDASIQSFAEKAAREALSVNNAKAVRSSESRRPIMLK